MRTARIAAAFDRLEATRGLAGAQAGSDEAGLWVRAGDERFEAHPGGWRSRAPIDEETRAALDGLREALRVTPPRSEALDRRSATRLLGEDGPRLAETVEAFAECYGQPLVAVFLEGDPVPSIRFPAVAPEQELLMYAPPPFREDARMQAYLLDLGFEVDRGCRVSTVPLPASFARRRARLEARGGLRPELVPLRWPLFSPAAWLREVARGVIPVNVNGRLGGWLARLARLPVPGATRAYLNNHFHALGHDVGLHGLALHRVPAPAMAELRRLARGARSVERAARFFEETLTRACVDLWAEVRRPEEFAPRFERAFGGLRRELAHEAGLA